MHSSQRRHSCMNFTLKFKEQMSSRQARRQESVQEEGTRHSAENPAAQRRDASWHTGTQPTQRGPRRQSVRFNSHWQWHDFIAFAGFIHSTNSILLGFHVLLFVCLFKEHSLFFTKCFSKYHWDSISLQWNVPIVNIHLQMFWQISVYT